MEKGSITISIQNSSLCSLFYIGRLIYHYRKPRDKGTSVSAKADGVVPCYGLGYIRRVCVCVCVYMYVYVCVLTVHSVEKPTTYIQYWQ